MSESIAVRTNQFPDELTRREMSAILSAIRADLAVANGGLLYGYVTYDAPSLGDGVGTTTTVTVQGAVLGDFVASVSLDVSCAGITVTGYVSAADTVSVRLQNESTGTVNLASATLRVLVLPKAAQGAAVGMIQGSAVYNTASLGDRAGATTTVAAIGAAIGDYSLVSFELDLVGITVTSYVSAADVVSVRIQNESGGTVDLASTTIRVRVIPYATFGRVPVLASLAGLLTGSATYDAASLADGVGESTDITVTGAALGDFALISTGIDMSGITVTGYVSAASTVTLRVQNESAGTLDIASQTIRATTIPSSLFPQAAALNTQP